ncbi:unnamed protein product [Calicophoron daubneyi]|uniref:ethanolamine kinase n=1 Tax=Calicophoron daubneyi TaxID=300641 RepID=A0AAV2TAV8_CALDB
MTVSALKIIDLTIAGPEDYEGLHSLTSFIFPNEFNGKLEVEALDQGLSNQLLRIRYGTGTSKPRVFLVRIYGETTNAMVDRNFEILCMSALNQHHSSQKLHAVFRNGISYSYIEGFTLPVSHMGTEKYARFISWAEE